MILGGKHQFQIVLYDHSCLEWSSPILDRNLGEYDFLRNTSGIRIKWIQTQDYHVFRMYSCRTGHGMHEKSWEYILSEQKLKTKNSWLRANSLKKWWVSTKKYGFFSGSKFSNVKSWFVSLKMARSSATTAWSMPWTWAAAGRRPTLLWDLFNLKMEEKASNYSH